MFYNAAQGRAGRPLGYGFIVGWLVLLGLAVAFWPYGIPLVVLSAVGIVWVARYFQERGSKGP